MYNHFLMCPLLLAVIILFVNPGESADPCTGAGENITGASSGFVSSPNFPGNFLPNKVCVWVITVPSGRIKLSFLNFTLEPGAKTECSGQGVARSPYIKLTNAASDDDNNPYFQLCGQKIPAPVYSVGNTIQIELISASSVYSGFNASYETFTDDMLCPNASQLTDMSGVITSPYYPRHYPNNQNCFWEITASKGNRVKLEVTDMAIHRCGGDACTCDYLEILDGFLVLNDQINRNPASGKICIDDRFTPRTYYSTNERLRVRFFSDPPAAKNFKGFTASYTQLNYTPPECPSAPIKLSGNGSFSSLNYPKSNYPSGRNCFWIITASAGKRVKVTIKDFHMGMCDNCNADYCSRVEFFDGPTENSSYLGRFCTSSNLTSKVSSGQQMFVKFYSSFSPDRGFRAEYFETMDEPSPPVTPTAPPTTGASLTTTTSPTATTSRTTTESLTATTSPTTAAPLTATTLPTTAAPLTATTLPTTAAPLIASTLPTTTAPLTATTSPTTTAPLTATTSPTTTAPLTATTLPTTTAPQITTVKPPTTDLSYVDGNNIGSTVATLTLANKEFLSNGNRTSYVQIIVIQLKENQLHVTSTNEKYSATNVHKDYKNQVKGEPYITTEFDYGKMKTFRIGDGKYYSRSVRRERRATDVESPREYFNGELNDDTNYAVFQRSFDSYGSYESEDVIRFTTKKTSSATTIVVLSVVVGILSLVILVGVVVLGYRHFYKGRKTRVAIDGDAMDMSATEMEADHGLILRNVAADSEGQKVEYETSQENRARPTPSLTALDNPTYGKAV